MVGWVRVQEREEEKDGERGVTRVREGREEKDILISFSFPFFFMLINNNNNNNILL